MTASEFQRIAVRLSNVCWCRHWLHFNHPLEEPWLMAVNCQDGMGGPADLYEADLTAAGLRPEIRSGATYWIVERTDEQGQAFRSE